LRDTLLDVMARTLNDITTEEMRFLVERYGEPRKLHFKADFRKFECDLVRESRAKGRLSDVTCFIRNPDSNYIVIQKHQYANTGIFRAPSGGATTGETIEEAAIREMREETGLTIRLIKLVLDLDLDVVCTEETIPWRSFVFLGEPIGGEMRPIDTHEIYEVAIMSREKLLGDVDRLMTQSGWGGFSYRAFLTREFFKALDELDI
jgi:ADP-ribose pyrophosphatase YjhB (NUDIX family)